MPASQPGIEGRGRHTCSNGSESRPTRGRGPAGLAAGCQAVLLCADMDTVPELIRVERRPAVLRSAGGTPDSKQMRLVLLHKLH